MATISLCMIVKNEEANLSKSLAPIAAHFDEVILVDTGSTDRTISLAGQYGAKVFVVPWQNDFALARNQSIEKASSDWILWFDADNRMEVTDVKKIKGLIDHQPDKVFWLTEVVEPRGDTLIQKRIFPNRADFRFAGAVHEQLIHPPEGIRYVMTDIQIYHWGYVDKEILKQKGLRNLQILQGVLARQPSDYFAHFNIARCYENFRDFTKAHAHLREVVQNAIAEQENPDIYLYSFIMTFLLYEKMGALEEGREILEVLRDKNPDFGLGWFYSGKYHFKLREFREAIGNLQRFQELGIAVHSLDLPRKKIFFESYYWLAQSYEKLGQAFLARDAYQKALAYEPQNSHVYLKLASLCRALGQAEEEKALLKKCLDLRPEKREKWVTQSRQR
jgi:glycosyltransferase involved in cell wall biosynthesis